MASNYPSGLDSLSNPASGDALSTGHAAQHSNVNDAIEAIEGELGLNPRGGSATVKARFDAIEANGWVTNARVADNTVTDAKLNQGWVTFSDTSVVCAATTRKLAQTGTMSASRSVTLPAANAVSAGTEIVVADASGSVTSTNTIVVTRAGADTINGAASVSIAAAYGWRRLVSDGTSKWSVDGGVVRLSDVGTITSTMIADATIVGGDIATGTVTSTNIADGTITGTDIASGTVTSTNILDGTIVNADINASAAIDVSKLSGVVTSAGVGNLLTANQASFETSVPASGTNCTITQDATYAVDGTKSMLMTSLAAGAMDNSGSAYSVAIPGPGTYTVYAKFRSDQTAMGAVVLAVGSGITQDGARANATSSGWTTLYGTFSATAATTVSVYISTSGAIGHPSAGGQKLWIDTVGVWRGAGGLWALPGTPIANLGHYTDESVGRRIFTWDTVNNRWQMTYGDTGVRDGGTSLGSGWSATWDLISRTGNIVTLNMILVKSGSVTVSNSEVLTTLPAGFRPQTSTYYIAGTLSGVAATTAYVLTSTGVLQFYGSTTGTISSPTAYVQVSYRTNDAWPASLPGSASGSIPQ